MLKQFIQKVIDNRKVNRVINICLIVSLALYIFSLPAFSARPRYNLISYGFMIISAFFVFLTYLFYEKFVFNRRLLILVFFILEAFIGTALFSHDFRHWFTIVLLFLTLVIFYYGFCAIKNKRLIFKMISYSLFAFSLYFAFVYRNQILHLNLNDALGDIFDNVNAIGTHFSLGSSIFLYLALSADKKREWIYFIPCAIMLGLGLFTGSRHFIITTGFTFIVTIFVGIKRRKWIALFAVVALIAIFLVILQLPALAALKERINRGMTTLFGIGNAKYDPSAVQRTIWPLYGFNLGIRHMIFGYGAEGFSIYSGIGTYSHNTYSEIICNFGVAGAFLFYFIFVYSLILALRSRNQKINLVYIIVAFYFIKGFFGVYFASKDAYIMIALIMFLTKEIHLGNFYEKGTIGIIRTNKYCEVNI